MSKLTISEIKAKLVSINNLDDSFLVDLQSDSRVGVQKLLKAKQVQINKLNQLKNEFKKRFNYENNFWRQGKNMVAGVDEVGRGPLAGPVVSCAIILPHDFDLYQVNDSKQLSPKIRQLLYDKILNECIAYGIGIADNHLIDKINIYEATRVAMKQAVNNLEVKPDEIIVDAMDIDLPIHQTKLIKGDAKSISISAASIVAKVYRDNLMDKYAQMYPEYDFIHNAGYGTKKHLSALKEFGATPIHRKTFSPVTKIINN
ncbi:ribonuclease HII [Apilactobacillus xinyiensis]|uniref:ribonuclease HII n=1 Tax=Apilactobacillus xinyiensis TaxID=2841032 RepID=UPI001C7D7CEF|nr:ribonuclease HII [Apilactobacillus xinyiensis]MCL0329377.1 ribonuclease HII [Apilactobacillus xinyiensis]